jgi:F-type H+-transporting ATPase subunit b
MFELNLTLPIFIVMFIVFIKVMDVVVLKPVGQTIERRQQKIKLDIEDASTARAKAAEIVKDYEIGMRETRIQAQAIITDVVTKGQKQRLEKLKLVNDQGQTRVQAAKNAIAAERTTLIGQLAQDEQGLVATIVKKLLGDSVSVLVDVDKARQMLVEEAS